MFVSKLALAEDQLLQAILLTEDIQQSRKNLGAIAEIILS